MVGGLAQVNPGDDDLVAGFIALYFQLGNALLATSDTERLDQAYGVFADFVRRLPARDAGCERSLCLSACILSSARAATSSFDRAYEILCEAQDLFERIEERLELPAYLLRAQTDVFFSLPAHDARIDDLRERIASSRTSWPDDGEMLAILREITSEQSERATDTAAQ